MGKAGTKKEENLTDFERNQEEITKPNISGVEHKVLSMSTSSIVSNLMANSNVFKIKDEQQNALITQHINSYELKQFQANSSHEIRDTNCTVLFVGPQLTVDDLDVILHIIKAVGACSLNQLPDNYIEIKFNISEFVNDYLGVLVNVKAHNQAVLDTINKLSTSQLTVSYLNNEKVFKVVRTPILSKLELLTEKKTLHVTASISWDFLNFWLTRYSYVDLVRRKNLSTIEKWMQTYIQSNVNIDLKYSKSLSSLKGLMGYEGNDEAFKKEILNAMNTLKNLNFLKKFEIVEYKNNEATLTWVNFSNKNSLWHNEEIKNIVKIKNDMEGKNV